MLLSVPICRCVALFALINAAAGAALGPRYGFTSANRLYGRADNDGYNAEDLSYLKKIAAIGDSYSAGIGAGARLGGFDDWQCSRYDHSYPYLFSQDERLGDPSGRTFEFRSCSGAVVDEVIEKQIPTLSSNQQVILLSAGGNDAELVNILNQCVFQWLTFEKSQGIVGRIAALLREPWALNLDWEDLSRGCPGQLTRSDEIIASSDFSTKLDRLIDSAKKKLASDGHIYYTGYAKFFSEDYSDECDKVSWSLWIYKLASIWIPAARLDSFNRMVMNGLVDRMNKQLKAAVGRAGDQVTFVDYDEFVGRFKGRFCESGVDEGSILDTSGESPRSMFFRFHSEDPFGINPWKRSTLGHGEATFEGDVNTFARAVEYVDPDARLKHEDKVDGDTRAAFKALSDDDSLKRTGEVPNLLPDGYGRVFHPQILLHLIIKNRIIFEIANRNLADHSLDPLPVIGEPIGTCPIDSGDDVDTVLAYSPVAAGEGVKKGTKLRILPVGDSITVGYPGRGDGDGYRRQLKNNLSGDEVVFAGTEFTGSMEDGYFAAWSGKTIQYISDHAQGSLKQRPNIILVAAGTNDMNPNGAISKEGNDPAGAAERLGKMIDKMFDACPDATILVAMIVNTCNQDQSPATKEYQKLIPGVVQQRKDDGKHILAADFTTFKTSDLADCIHPTPDGYKIMGDYWYSFIHQIPANWIKDPVGSDPTRNSNEGLDGNIPPPDWGTIPIHVTSKNAVRDAAAAALGGTSKPTTCNGNPNWKASGKIALGGVGKSGPWKFRRDWREAGEVASGLGWGNAGVRLHDMNGDGKADYVWIHPDTGEIRCWLNNLPAPWSPAGNNNSIIGSGVGPSNTIFLADMNGDGMDDYLVVDGKRGSVRVWWNYGPDDSWVNGWKFVAGGEIASGVPYANLDTIKFPDINGDGRADYVYIGKGGSVKHHMNTGSPGGQDVLFHAMGGIATGAVDDISKLVFADMNGDGRDDYLIWDNDGGLSGFLNQPTNREGVPIYVAQGGAKIIAEGIKQKPSDIRLADMDGDGKDDYVLVGDNGALYVWYNRGETDDSLARENVHFADLDGDGLDDYVWVDSSSGAPTAYLNKGVDSGDSLGWRWSPVNGGKPIASGAAPSSRVFFGDIDGNGLADYLDIDPKTGAIKAYLNMGASDAAEFADYKWRFQPIGTIASGLGPGSRVRIADIDGDGRDDYIYLKDNGGTTIYRNVWSPDNDGDKYKPMPDADASGIGQSPDEIEFVDLNGDGKADYVWTRKLDGRAHVWYNEYPNKPTWRAGGEIAGGVGTSGANVKYGKLLPSGRSDYIPIDPNTGAIGAWLNGCSNQQSSKRSLGITMIKWINHSNNDLHWWTIYEHHVGEETPDELTTCVGAIYPSKADIIGNVHRPEDGDDRFPTFISADDFSTKGPYGNKCYFLGSPDRVGNLVCDGIAGIHCYEASKAGEAFSCGTGGRNSATPSMYCEWN